MRAAALYTRGHPGSLAAAIRDPLRRHRGLGIPALCFAPARMAGQGKFRMFYREAGQYKTSYAADMAVFPLRQDRIGLALIIAAAYALAFTNNDFLLQAVMIPFL